MLQNVTYQTFFLLVHCNFPFCKGGKAQHHQHEPARSNNMLAKVLYATGLFLLSGGIAALVVGEFFVVQPRCYCLWIMFNVSASCDILTVLFSPKSPFGGSCLGMPWLLLELGKDYFSALILSSCLYQRVNDVKSCLTHWLKHGLCFWLCITKMETAGNE